MTLRQTIQAAMHKQCMTAYRLEQLTGINRSTIGRYLAGKTEIKSDNLQKILDVLNLEVKS